MCDESVIRRLAGIFILISLGLAVWVSPWWLLFTAFVGLNLVQAGFTSFCPLERVLGRFRVLGCRGAAGRTAS
jgi:Inner membrane protein YgaP-like, transmembrane domain